MAYSFKWIPFSFCYLCYCLRELTFLNYCQAIRSASSRALNYAAAAACIKATKETVQGLRRETEWVNIWEQAVALASKHNIAVVAPRRRTRRLPERFSGTVVTSETTRNRSIQMDEYHIYIFYATQGVVVAEMNQRFGDLNLSLLGALQALLPSSEKFLDVDSLSPFFSIMK